MKRTRFALAAFFGTFGAAAQVVGFSYGQRNPVKEFEPVPIRCICPQELAELRAQGIKLAAGLMLPAARSVVENLPSVPIPAAQSSIDAGDAFGYQERNPRYGFNVIADFIGESKLNEPAPNWSPLVSEHAALAKNNCRAKKNAKTKLSIIHHEAPVEAPPVEPSAGVAANSPQGAGHDQITYEAAFYDEFGYGGIDGYGYPFNEGARQVSSRRTAAPAEPIGAMGSLNSAGSLNNTGRLHGTGSLSGSGNLGGHGNLSAVGPIIGVGPLTGHSRLTESGPLSGAGPLSVEGRLGGGGPLTGAGLLTEQRQLNSGTLSGTGPLGGMGFMGRQGTLSGRGSFNGQGNLKDAGPLRGEGLLNSGGPLQGQGQLDGRGSLNGSWLFRGTGPVEAPPVDEADIDPFWPERYQPIAPLSVVLQDPALSAGHDEALRINYANDGLHPQGSCPVVGTVKPAPMEEQLSEQDYGCGSVAVSAAAPAAPACTRHRPFGFADAYQCPLADECHDLLDDEVEHKEAAPAAVAPADAAEYDYDDTYGIYDGPCYPYLGEDACEDVDYLGPGVCLPACPASATRHDDTPVEAPPCTQQGCGYWYDFDGYDACQEQTDFAGEEEYDYDYDYGYGFEASDDGIPFGNIHSAPAFDDVSEFDDWDYDCYGECYLTPASKAMDNPSVEISSAQAERLVEVAVNWVRNVSAGMQQVQQKVHDLAASLVETTFDVAPWESPLAPVERTAELKKVDLAPATGKAFGPQPATEPGFQLLPMPQRLPEFMFPAEQDLGL